MHLKRTKIAQFVVIANNFFSQTGDKYANLATLHTPLPSYEQRVAHSVRRTIKHQRGRMVHIFSHWKSEFSMRSRPYHICTISSSSQIEKLFKIHKYNYYSKTCLGRYHEKINVSGNGGYSLGVTAQVKFIYLIQVRVYR